ncbi:hypothetical protein ACLOJK_038172 [Asimina triloba]
MSKLYHRPNELMLDGLLSNGQAPLDGDAIEAFVGLEVAVDVEFDPSFGSGTVIESKVWVG